MLVVVSDGINYAVVVDPSFDRLRLHGLLLRLLRLLLLRLNCHTGSGIRLVWVSVYFPLPFFTLSLLLFPNPVRTQKRVMIAGTDVALSPFPLTVARPMSFAKAPIAESKFVNLLLALFVAAD